MLTIHKHFKAVRGHHLCACAIDKTAKEKNAPELFVEQFLTIYTHSGLLQDIAGQKTVKALKH